MSPGSMGLPIEQIKSQVRLTIENEINRLTTAAKSLTNTVNIMDFNSPRPIGDSDAKD